MKEQYKRISTGEKSRVTVTIQDINRERSGLDSLAIANIEEEKEATKRSSTLSIPVNKEKSKTLNLTY